MTQDSLFKRDIFIALHQEKYYSKYFISYQNKSLWARAALESSLKRGNMGIGQRRFWEEETTFRHRTFDFWDLGVVKKKLKFKRKNSESHSQSHSES